MVLRRFAFVSSSIFIYKSFILFLNRDDLSILSVVGLFDGFT